MTKQRMLSVAQVADMFGVHATTIRRWWAAEEFPRPIKCGSTYRWDPQVIEEFIARKQGAAAAEVQPIG